MKLLYYGGQKSGKSLLAEQKALSLAGGRKPVYLATYDSGYDDPEMGARIALHREQRAERFVTIEEPLDLVSRMEPGGVYLIDCMSMWLLNTIEWSRDMVLAQVEHLAEVEADIVLVLNDVGSGVIPMDKLSREYVDRSGIVGQRLAQICDEVYEVKLGLEVQLK